MMKDFINLVRIRLIKDDIPQPKIQIASPRYAAKIIKEYLSDMDREVVIALLLDSKNKITSIYEVSMGSVCESITHPREVFKAAILANACGIILGHNHLSGDCTPSPEDVRNTRRIYDCGNLMGIYVFDHIIVSDNDYYSFKENTEIMEG